jgi:hypothetical protein
MTMIETAILSILSLFLMIYETIKRQDLMKREARLIIIEEMEPLDQTADKFFGGAGPA